MLEAVTWAAIKAFFGKYWEIILVVILLLAGVWYLDHRGYERAKDEDAARQLEQVQLTGAVVRQIDGDLGGKLEAIASSTSDKIQTIDTEGKTVVQPIITRELIRDPALSAANSCLTPSLLEAVNAARGYGAEELTDAGAPVGSGKSAPVPTSAARP